MEWLPVESAEAHVALPLASATFAQSVVLPSRNVTVPVAAPAEPVMLAVKVTICPALDGFVEEASDTVVVARETPDTVKVYEAI